MALPVPTGTLRNEHTGPLHECSVGFFQAPSMSSHHARPRAVTTPYPSCLSLFRDLATRRFAAQELHPPNSRYPSSRNGPTSLFRNSGFWKSSPLSFQLARPEITMWINGPDPPVVDGPDQIAISRFRGLKTKTSVLPARETRDHDVDQWSRSTCARRFRSNRHLATQRFEK
jgi:hypothetical protein